GDGFACSLLTDKSVVCWGANKNGQIGNHSNKRALTPYRVHGVDNQGLLGGVVAVATGSHRSPCAILSTKNVVCWGFGINGELGNNSMQSSSTPVKVLGVGGTGFLGNAKAVTGAGPNSSCALIVGGTVDCWGFNSSLGINSI